MEKILNVELNDIAMFVEVGRRLSFTQASEALSLPAGTLSRRVTQLEKRLGMKLISRSTRQLVLTPEGQAYLARCSALIDHARTAHLQLQDQASQPSGRLCVSLPVSLGLLLLPDMLQPFLDAYPQINCDFDFSMAEVDAIDNPFDVVLRFGEQPDSSLVSRQLTLISHHLYASRVYLDQHGVPATPADLTHHQCLRPVIGSSDMIWSLYSGPHQEKVTVSGQLAANNIGLCARLAAQGLGITPLPAFPSMTRAINQTSLVRVLPEWQLAPIALYALLPVRSAPAKTQAFLAFIQPLLEQVALEAEPGRAQAVQGRDGIGKAPRRAVTP